MNREFHSKQILDWILKIIYWKSCQALEQAAQWTSGVTIPGDT